MDMYTFPINVQENNRRGGSMKLTPETVGSAATAFKRRDWEIGDRYYYEISK